MSKWVNYLTILRFGQIQIQHLMVEAPTAQLTSPEEIHTAIGAEMPDVAGLPEQGGKDVVPPGPAGAGGHFNNGSPRCDNGIAVPQSMKDSTEPEACGEACPTDMDSISCAKHAYLVRYSSCLQAPEDAGSTCPYCPHDQEDEESVGMSGDAHLFTVPVHC
jgi:hypothetical protein